MTEFHCNCGATITGTKRDVAMHLAACATTHASADQPHLFDDTPTLPLFAGVPARVPEPAPFTPTQAARQLAIEMAREDSARDRERRDSARPPEPRKAKTKSGFHLNQTVEIVTNWRTEQPDGRIGTISKIHRAYHGVGGSDVSTALEVEVDLGNGQWHKTFPKYLKAVEVCRECGRRTELQEGLCFDCWRYQEGVTIDYRSQDQRHIDELADGDEDEGDPVFLCPVCKGDVYPATDEYRKVEGAYLHASCVAKARPPEPPAPRVCEQCADWRRTHHDMPARFQLSGVHGMCVSPAQPNHIEHKASVACAWFASADAPPAPMMADSDIVDPLTGEVIAVEGEGLTDEVLYRLEMVGVTMAQEDGRSAVLLGRRCPYYGAEVPDDWRGCAACRIARECYELYEVLQDTRICVECERLIPASEAIEIGPDEALFCPECYAAWERAQDRAREERQTRVVFGKQKVRCSRCYKYVTPGREHRCVF